MGYVISNPRNEEWIPSYWQIIFITLFFTNITYSLLVVMGLWSVYSMGLINWKCNMLIWKNIISTWQIEAWA